ncbi:MAG TPA: prolyl oligopeptidase family serine peptidase [Allosphingosinicella sp.]|jgi:prolyl oligopeptidase
MRIAAAAFLLLPLSACAMKDASPEQASAHRASLVYPVSERQNIVENQFGVQVADPYRWLEDDVRVNPKVRQWVAEQNALTESYLATLPAKPHFQQRMTQLFSYERIGIPTRKGGRYFYGRNTGLQNQNVLYVRDGLNGAPRMLIDPNTWSDDGATALAEWEPSRDGKRLLYSIQEGGTDWRIVRVLDVDSGKTLPDEVKWVKFSSLDWAKDGSGFFYSRFPEPKAEQQFQSGSENHNIYFHKLGTPQSQDRLIFQRVDQPKLLNFLEVSDDGRWLVVTSSQGGETNEVSVVDLQQPGATPRRLVSGFESSWSYVGNVGSTFYWITDAGAARQKIVATDISRSGFEHRTIVPEDEATLGSASIVGGQLIASYLVHAKTEVRTFALDGRRLGAVTLPGIGSAGGFSGDADDPETFFSFTSFNVPAAVYRYDARTGQTSVWAEPRVPFTPADFTVEQRFYRSKDGTRIPLFLVYRKGLDLSKPRPTLLYGYGGFNSSLTPSFSSTNLAWVEQGGVYAAANLRGGGEYGKAWHDAGRLANKQNVFDDFIAAAEYMIRERITAPEKLAIYGRSNGGLLVGAVVNQRPELFGAALPAVGVMDMLRFNRWTAGRYWVSDYGQPDRDADFRTLWAYSPYHNIRSGRDYPAILVTTADTDDRVVPGHSFKYTAALQAANTGPQPKLIRIETRAGHGSGKPTEKIIDEFSDMWAFIAHHTGLRVGETATARR